MNTATTTRSLREIAAEINADWKNVNYGAVPYLNAMSQLDSVNDGFFAESAQDIVIRFLCNASTWRGETAKRIKAELKKLAGVK
jgi:hypothetical protein